MFNIKKPHLERLELALSHYGKVCIHGDGNIYVYEESKDGGDTDSDFHKKFSDPKIEGAAYVLVFTKGDRIPATEKELEEMFIAAKAKENAYDSVPKEEARIKTLPEPKKQGRPKKEE